ELLGVPATDEEVRLVPKPDLPHLIETVQSPDFVCPTYFTTNTSGSGSVMVFRDSFGTALKPFLGYYFAEADFFWTFGNFDRKVVENSKPTVVITELVERHLHQQKSGQKGHSEDQLSAQ